MGKFLYENGALVPSIEPEIWLGDGSARIYMDDESDGAAVPQCTVLTLHESASWGYGPSADTPPYSPEWGPLPVAPDCYMRFKLSDLSAQALDNLQDPSNAEYPLYMMAMVPISQNWDSSTTVSMYIYVYAKRERNVQTAWGLRVVSKVRDGRYLPMAVTDVVIQGKVPTAADGVFTLSIVSGGVSLAKAGVVTAAISAEAIAADFPGGLYAPGQLAPFVFMAHDFDLLQEVYYDGVPGEESVDKFWTAFKSCTEK